MTAKELSEHARAAGISVSITGMVREADAARLLMMSLRQLQNWKSDGSAPSYTRVGGRNWYSLADLAAKYEER